MECLYLDVCEYQKRVSFNVSFFQFPFLVSKHAFQNGEGGKGVISVTFQGCQLFACLLWPLVKKDK